MSTKPASPIDLPAPIASYFARETTDPQAIARCFSEDAMVHDEGHRHQGRAAIAAWHAEAVRKYQSESEPLVSRTVGAETTVTARVTGTFPGSPVNLRFRFTVEGDHITQLKIVP